MELNEAIRNRRSVRKFKDVDVPKEIIEDLIEHARLAPSAKNRQPWKFVIVKDSVKDKISNMMIEKEESLKTNFKNEVHKFNSSVLATAKIIKEAPVLILVLKYNENNWMVGDLLSIGGAIEHICLRATDLGLGSLWIRDICYVQEEIAKLIKHENMEVISAVSIGYTNEKPNEKKKKMLNEVLEWY